MSARSYAKSNEALQRALKTIPLGSQTFSKSHQQFPQGAAPLFLDRGRGGRVWDIDGHEYVDLICGLLPVLLGYQDKDVDEAIIAQLGKGISFSLSTTLEFKLSEMLVDLIPCAEMVRYGKNGTDATSGAVRLARGFTGKDHIIALGYHGWQDWYIGATIKNLGIPKSTCALTTKVAYNDLDALRAEFKKFEGDVAAVIMEPMNTTDPQEGYLEAVKAMAHENGALLIFDEVITGFRFANGGAQVLFGVTPDLAAFGKAMGNGMPISALVGRADVMSLMDRIFYSSTFGGEALSLAASIAVIEKMQREPVVETLWKTGSWLAEETLKKIAEAGLAQNITLCGKAPWKILQFADHAHGSKEAIKTLFLKEMLAGGVLLAGSHNICYAHTKADMDHVLKAYTDALAVVKAALEKPGLDERLGIPPIHPVFSVR
ncbi:MAG: aminotransferase class III-fold pyridoxal phosphate-dependent enzyme [Alphaproteobacteria bacterium]|nr:aminotransferase class III-fold pyridoxal phosphate-dependent enzyme [Alphaproteobacteria bacterium]